MADDEKLVTVTRIIEMHGSPAWINEILKKSFVPINGTKQIGPRGFYMRGGVVMWSQPAEPATAAADQSPEPAAESVEEPESVPAAPATPKVARFESRLSSEPLRDRPPLRVPKPTGAK
jgi:hypothetical protein